MSTSAPPHARHVALAVMLGAAALYWLCLPVVFSGDDLQYATVVERGARGGLFYHPAAGQPYVPTAERAALDVRPASPPLNPRYLLEWPTSVVVARAWIAAGLPGDASAPIQAHRILVGALGLGLFFLAVDGLVRHRGLALLATSGLGLSAAYVTYSTHMDQSINMVMLLVLAFYLFVRQSEADVTLGGRALLALVLAGATFYNFTAALSALAFGLGVAVARPDTSLAGRLRRFVGFGVGYTLIVVVVIAAAVAVFVSPASLTDPAYWRTVTFGGRPEYGVSLLTDTARGAIGLAKSQTVFPGVAGDFADYFAAAPPLARVRLVSFFAVVFVCMMLPFVLLGARMRRPGADHRMFPFLAAWLGAHAVFNWFWDPGFNKYWLVPLVACWAAAALALAHLRQHQPRAFRPAVLATLAFVLASGAVNLTTQFLPQSRAAASPWRRIADELRAASRPTDLFVSPGHPMDFYLAYFARRDVVSTWLVAYDRGGDATDLARRLAARIAAHRADGGTVYAYGLEALPPDERAAFEALLGGGSWRQAWSYAGATTIHEVTHAVAAAAAPTGPR